MAYEGFFYWQDWPQYLGVTDESGRPGTCSRARSCSRAAPAITRRCSSTTATSGSSTRSGTTRSCGGGCRSTTPARSGRRSGPMTRTSGTRPAASSTARSTPRLGLRQRPPAGDSQPPARRRGQRRRVPVPGRGGRDPPRQRPRHGVTLADGHQIDAQVVVNVAGPHSFVINRMAGVEDDDEGQDPAAAPRGPPRARAAGLRLRGRRLSHLRRRHRDLLPARVGQPHPDRLRGPRVRPAGVGRRSRRATTATSPRPSGRRRCTGWRGGSRRCGSRTSARDRRPLRRLRRLDPDLRPVRSRRLLHGDRDQRQPVQERAGGRAPDGRADRQG